MMMIRSIALITFFILSGSVYSQTATSTVTLTLPVVTLMDVEPTGNFTLNFTAPTEAGNALGNPTPNTSKWINYTSAIAPGGLTRKITASVSKVIDGVNIRLQAAAASGAGGGTLGTSSGQVTLTVTPVTIISGIGGAYTGNGANNGHRLTISLVTGNYALLLPQANTAVTIVYTITE
ncbi:MULTISPECIES: hypothetical protein [Chryseobacterium]|jgi:hypothetical protein|uniref:DUF4402 domain-containing protein n=1 Tax=Chryseobacterium rhizosphaerae TaxID=395937 RepID=A0AAE3YEF2_9FLAO|nr:MULTISPECIES: hypothetical protein [Chryseobacterium]MBL3550380.1 hypothetical protein [Chryseobacterium sp. KMC2]MDR6528952.1 hypothetical protein [Chryseobacterium rhizosphaerae]MDR6546779.1 hypothetical protein [Chryseobacterium rhizosphaerae]REC70167.1 hypothetical protein DRF57_22405 [Chryseobacterium rhizosphaerae]GEN69815.1 hypothetical protein CRH01_43830 [Chryseobacterium rhizosphaerae]